MNDQSDLLVLRCAERDAALHDIARPCRRDSAICRAGLRCWLSRLRGRRAAQAECCELLGERAAPTCAADPLRWSDSGQSDQPRLTVFRSTFQLDPDDEARRA